MNTIQDEAKTSSESFWKYIKNCKKEGAIPSNILYDGAVADSGEEICGLFACFFKSVYEPQPFSICYQLNYPNVVNSIFFIPEIVCDEFKALYVKKGAGSNSYLSYFVENCETLCYPLKKLFNKSIIFGPFPNAWKTAFLIPIFRNSSDRNSVESYQAVSKLSVFRKVFESIVFDSLFFSLKLSTTKSQHEFFLGRSIETNLILYT